MEITPPLQSRSSLVRVSDGASFVPLPMMSETDLEISRHRIAVFLSAHMAYELLPESVKVVVLDVDLPVKQAFHILHEQGISMAPLWDFSKGKFVGVLSALDFILIMREIGSHGSHLTEEELERHTILDWKEAKLYMNSQVNGFGSSVSRRLVQEKALVKNELVPDGGEGEDENGTKKQF